MSLHPSLGSWLEGLNVTVAALKKAGFEPTPTNARESLANTTKAFVTGAVETPIVKDFCLSTPGFAVPVRAYAQDLDSQLPLIVYCHGGGHMAGSISVYDPICRRISQRTGATVIALDYRLAPENRYPAGLNDLRHALKVVRRDAEKRGIHCADGIVLGGDSGGAAMVASLSAEYSVAPANTYQLLGQFLIYPSLDYQLRFDSYLRNGTGLLLERAKIAWYFDNYFESDEQRKGASPIDMEIGAHYPATLVVSAAYDPLVDEAKALISALKTHGVSVTELAHEDMVHAFLNLEDLVPEACAMSYEAMAKFVRGLASS